MGERNVKSHETIILILKEDQFLVDKQILISKSQYFAALLSENFLEHRQRVHVIEYDISWISMQDFIDWIYNDKINISAIKYYDIAEIDRLVNLLELGRLFAADKLIEDVTERLEEYYMSPENAIKLWITAQNLSINVLRDISLAICLDRFDELPLQSIINLTKENFLKLIGNNNISSTESHLLHITNEWMNHHNDFTIPLDIIKNKKKKILNCIISCEGSDIINSEQFIHCWDGNEFFELTSFKYPKDIIDCSTDEKTALKGMEIIGRKNNLYLCGGEFGINSGKFNKNIWRYSLISKKWFLETGMPSERRNMIAVFLKNKLVLVGGVGRDKQFLRSVDIYDIYTGLWTFGAKMGNDLEFHSAPEYYVCNGKLIINRYMCIDCDMEFNVMLISYCPVENVWEKRNGIEDLKFMYPIDNNPILELKSLPCYIDTSDPDNMILRALTTFHKECKHEQSITRVVLGIVRRGLEFHFEYDELSPDIDVSLIQKFYSSYLRKKRETV
ncbi:uncharacterized protein [Mycetomoellerius zeteki]|uniref:uncharacterized protein n=1 Tax=Mycetomoellerius zeteki TaxID=64791 RepID=UPI00084E52DD|nr:PREDICTED: uncharacterized protein LOC108724930 [Trachymyrmex zeteki]